MDILATSVHLPINIWLANAELVHEAFETDGGSVVKPRIQNIKDIETHGFSLANYLDDETHLFNEPKTAVEVPVLTAVGPKLRDVKMLSGAEEINIPINAFSYALYAIMQGLDPDVSISDSASIRLDNAGYEDPGNVPNEVFDAIATFVDKQESIDTIRFTLLAHLQPSDPTQGDKYILATKLSISMEAVQQMVNKEYYKQTIALKAVILTDNEVARWQNIFPSVKKTIGMYSFHVDVAET